MDPESQGRRIPILTVIFALLVVANFWILHSHNVPFSSNRREASSRAARMKSTLESIHPPAGDPLGTVEIVNFPSGDIWKTQIANFPSGETWATRMNSTQSHCSTVEAHYKEEFARHGFTYTGTQEASETTGRSLFFSSRDYAASLSCSEGSFFQTYRIVLESYSHD